MRRRNFSSAGPGVLAAALLASACSPVFNWREVPIVQEAPAGLVALLPCKPDRATRSLPLGGETLTLEMAGCEAGGATFAVTHIAAADPVQAGRWMRAWQDATRAQWQVAQEQSPAPSVLRAAASPAPAGASGQAPGGVPVRTLWFAQQRGATWSLYQATVLGTPSSAEAVPAFFEGLRLP